MPFIKDHTEDKAQGDALYQQAFAAYQSGDYQQSLGLIEKADTLKPDQPDGWNLRGMVYLKQNAYGKAEAAFEHARMLDPKLWAAQFNLAEAPFQGKDYARARSRFEALLDQTDRFKEAKKWELVQFKAFLSTLLMGNALEAAKKLEKLPTKDGVTPAYLYAQAATSFSRRDAAAARKSLATAQSAYSPQLNDLFSNSLAEVGWVNNAPPPTYQPPSSSGPSSHAPPEPLPEAAPVPPLAPLPADAPKFADKYAPIVIDPKMEAVAADPLPTGSNTGAHPMMPKVTPMAAPPRQTPRTVSNQTVPQAPTPPPPEIAPDHRGLLLE